MKKKAQVLPVQPSGVPKPSFLMDDLVICALVSQSLPPRQSVPRRLNPLYISTCSLCPVHNQNHPPKTYTYIIEYP